MSSISVISLPELIIPPPGFTAFAAGDARLFGRELVRMSAHVSSFAAFACNFALLLRIHGREAFSAVCHELSPPFLCDWPDCRISAITIYPTISMSKRTSCNFRHTKSIFLQK